MDLLFIIVDINAYCLSTFAARYYVAPYYIFRYLLTCIAPMHLKITIPSRNIIYNRLASLVRGESINNMTILRCIGHVDGASERGQKKGSA